MDDEQILARAHRSGSELRETEETFAKLRAAMIEEMLASPLLATLHREKLYLAVQSLDAVKAALFEAAQAAEVINYRALLAEQGLTNTDR